MTIEKKPLKKPLNGYLPSFLASESTIRISDEKLASELRLPNPAYKEEISDLQRLINLFLLNKKTAHENPSEDQKVEKAEKEEQLQMMQSNYTIVDKIGEGTFSSVYRAIDEFHSLHINLHDYRSNVKEWWEPWTGHVSPKVRCWTSKSYVAIKRIYQTSSPARLLSEIEIIKKLCGLSNCVPLIEAFRQDDQVFLVMPFFEHQEFRVYMHLMNVKQIRHYMMTLLDALKHLHSVNVIHRDIKPANFLYDMDAKQGLLVDFGLAQYESEIIENLEKYEISSSKKRKIQENKWVDDKTGKMYSVPPFNPHKPGYMSKDPRPVMKAPRAGTRGFRAPEVLFRYPHQSTKIDIWAAGVIMLSLLTKQFPLFNSQDDMDALVELACIFGHDEMKKTARLSDRRWECNIPTVPKDRIPWRTFCGRFNPKMTEEAPDELFDLLDKLLCLDHKKRYSAEEALKHPFIDNICFY